MKKKALRVKPLPHQKAFLKSENTHTGLIGGYGCGKTYAGVLKTIIKHLRLQENVAYYLPTYPLIKDIAFPVFSEMLEQSGTRFTLNQSSKEFITDYGKIILRSMDNPDLIVGYEVAYSLIDEADLLPLEKMKRAYVKILGRNRANKNGKNNLDFVSTPEGFNFLYNFFIKEKSDKKTLIKGKTLDNPNLPKDYIENLQALYTDTQLEAYLNGEFVNLQGNTVYYNFDRDKHHVNANISPNDVLHIGMDFNVDQMAACVLVVRDGKPIILEELAGLKNTPEMISAIKTRYSGHNLVIYPDSSGKNRKTIGVSDIQALKQAGFIVKFRGTNPFVKDRISNVNRLLMDGSGEIKLKINTLNCPRLTEALEQITYKNGEVDKYSGLDHVTDAMGYVLFYLGKYFR